MPKIFTEDELILIDSDPKTVKTWIAHHEEEEREEELEHLIDDSDTKDTSRDESKDGDIESQLAATSVNCFTGSRIVSNSDNIPRSMLGSTLMIHKNAGSIIRCYLLYCCVFFFNLVTSCSHLVYAYTSNKVS